MRLPMFIASIISATPMPRELAELRGLGRCGEINALKLLGWQPQGRHYWALRSSRFTECLGNGPVLRPLPFALWIGCHENMATAVLFTERPPGKYHGQHYSRFSLIRGIASKQDQLLARSRDGENRRGDGELANFG